MCACAAVDGSSLAESADGPDETLQQLYTRRYIRPVTLYYVLRVCRSGTDVVEHELRNRELRIEEGVDGVTPPPADDGITINGRDPGVSGDCPVAGVVLVTAHPKSRVDRLEDARFNLLRPVDARPLWQRGRPEQEDA